MIAICRPLLFFVPVLFISPLHSRFGITRQHMLLDLCWNSSRTLSFLLREFRVNYAFNPLTRVGPCRNAQSPTYAGRLTFRGTLKPLESSRITPKIWVVCPGTYALSGWRLETEVVETVSEEDAVRILHRYQEEPALGFVTVSDMK